MEDKLAVAEKNVLIDIVKLVQRRRIKGTSGDWKEFLKVHDKKFGSSISDPAKRSIEDLVSFLKTFDKEEDLEFIDKLLQCQSNYGTRKQFMQNPAENESAEYKLIRSTVEHPLYQLDYLFPSHDEGWVVTTSLNKKAKVKGSYKLLAVDCEMVQCEDGTEGLVRFVSWIAIWRVKLDQLVKPDKAITDYRTEITGITAKSLDGVTCTLAVIQEFMKKIISYRNILVGHSLHNDLKDRSHHPWVIDTSFIFKYSTRHMGKRPSLNNLCTESKGDRYSALAIFKNSQEADLAFENVTGNVEQDTTGRPHKLVELKPNENEPAHLIYVRKMGHGIPRGEISSQKRAFEGHDDSKEHKKVKTTHEEKGEIMADLKKCDKQEQATNLSEQILKECSQNSKLSDDNPMEIQNLKQELRDRYLFG